MNVALRMPRSSLSRKTLHPLSQAAMAALWPLTVQAPA